MAGRARAVPVRLTIKRRRKLEQIVRAATSPQRLVLRAKIVLAAAAGTQNAQIARDLGCSVVVVRTWRGRFARLGIPGLFDKPRSGRPEVHGPSARLAVIAVCHVRPARRGIAVVARAGRRPPARAGPGDLGGHRGPGAGRGQGPPAQGPRMAQPRR
jgi:hypothetical protein